jgi:asparagine synthase (glutamine-hydrolysing)
MCGITGAFAFTESGKINTERVGSAIAALANRGPDDNGTFTHGRVMLGHTRLSIIDTSDAASQPFTDHTGRYTIVFNGEFFNFGEHRKALEEKGIKLRSTSDTEVLLYLFIEEKEKCLEKINGFFSFAVYDNIEQALFIARDRFGIKPLLYYIDKEKLLFAS